MQEWFKPYYYMLIFDGKVIAFGESYGLGETKEVFKIGQGRRIKLPTMAIIKGMNANHGGGASICWHWQKVAISCCLVRGLQFSRIVSD